VRFPKTLLGSSAIAGTVTPDMLDTADASGVTLADALRALGGDANAIASEAYKRDDVVGYLELHIEQGPVLEREGEALGVVSAIASQGRYRLRVKGEPGHAGTVPMALRHDALAAAAEVIVLVEDCGRKNASAGAVATVGEITALPGASNVIPGEVLMSLDLRAPADQLRQAMARSVRSWLGEIAARRGVAIDMEIVHEKPVAICAPRIKYAAAVAIERVTGSRPRELMSGAGHDGQAMIRLTDVGMIFVRCRGGISHSPLEFVGVDDLGLAVEALIQTIVELGREPQPQTV
jgi:allantoate deiminase